MELHETHSREEGDPQCLVLMNDARNATIEEVTNNFTLEQLVSDAPSFSIKEPKASKWRRKLIKPMVEHVSTAKTTR